MKNLKKKIMEREENKNSLPFKNKVKVRILSIKIYNYRKNMSYKIRIEEKKTEKKFIL